MQGNEAVVEGALVGGCRFFAGYPITPSSEIAEHLSVRLPEVEGRFIQMEDEIASMAAIIGASLAGLKAMTATSGPGFSLMQENIVFACIADVPCVVVNVQRGGPSTGLPTKPAQGDVMQARWGTHGDHPAIVLCPSSVRECFDLTIRAFNLSERFRTPVILLLDEIVGHMRERVVLPDPEKVEVWERMRPTVPPEWYLHYEDSARYVSPMASFGQWYRFHVTGLAHDQAGFPTDKTHEITAMMNRLRNKIERYKLDIIRVEKHFLEGAKVSIFAYGATARAAMEAIRLAQHERRHVGFLRPLTIWPFPEIEVEEMLREAEAIIVPEMNQGQLIREVERVNLRKGVRIVGINRVDGEPITPEQIFQVIREVG